LAFVSFSLTGIARMEGTVAVDVAEVVAEALIAEPRRKITDSGGRQGKQRNWDSQATNGNPHRLFI
jgi:hypothetical protein